MTDSKAAVKTIAEKLGLEVAAGSGGLEREAEGVFCCDLLSMAMGRAPEGSAWVTVMGNMNAVAVASLADTACIIVAEGAPVDSDAIEKANGLDIPVLKSPQPVFETALAVYSLLKR